MPADIMTRRRSATRWWQTSGSPWRLHEAVSSQSKAIRSRREHILRMARLQRPGHVSLARCVRKGHHCDGSCTLVCRHVQRLSVDSHRGSSVKLGTIQRILAWPLRKDDTRKSRSVRKHCLRRSARNFLPDLPIRFGRFGDVPYRCSEYDRLQ